MAPAFWDFRADVAQLVEHSLGKGEVTGSIPVISSRIERLMQLCGISFQVANGSAKEILDRDGNICSPCDSGLAGDG